MKKYQLFKEWNDITIYGESLVDAVRRIEKFTTDSTWDRNAQKIVPGEIHTVKKIIGIEDTSNATRGGKPYETVLFENEYEQIKSIDAIEIPVKVTAVV